jgi:hypothetical protein
MVLGNFMRLSCLWLPIDANGWGTYLSFVDGEYRDNSDVTYSATSTPFPGATGSPPVGAFSEGDAMRLPIFLNTADNKGAGIGAKFYIDWVSVVTSGTPTLKFRHSKLGARGGVRQMAA